VEAQEQSLLKAQAAARRKTKIRAAQRLKAQFKSKMKTFCGSLQTSTHSHTSSQAHKQNTHSCACIPTHLIVEALMLKKKI
jgi:hypothetical protein